MNPNSMDMFWLWLRFSLIGVACFFFVYWLVLRVQQRNDP